MNKFELFCMIFFVIDADWDETKDIAVGNFLSDANPFLFEDNCSANPEVFERFCEIIDDTITIENSFSFASKYIADLNDDGISKAFSSISERDWFDSVIDYMSQEHKGQGFSNKN